MHVMISRHQVFVFVFVFVLVLALEHQLNLHAFEVGLCKAYAHMSVCVCVCVCLRARIRQMLTVITVKQCMKVHMCVCMIKAYACCDCCKVRHVYVVYACTNKAMLIFILAS